MRDLTPVRLSAGGSVLVLVDGHGVEYAVGVGSLRETLGRAGTTEVPTVPQRKEAIVESSLRPRDIQARIRAGESPEDVAAVAGSSVEKVMIFASPVLAERAHVAQAAQAASVRRAVTDPTAPAVSSVRTLGPAAATRLRDEGVDPESVVWDAWRREDGRWTLSASFSHGAEDHVARFSYDTRGSFVMADDDDARWLVGDGQVPARAPKPVPAAVAEAPTGLRLAPAYVAEVARPALGDDALDLLSSDTADADWMAATPAAPPAEQVVAPEVPAAEVAEETAATVETDDVADDEAEPTTEIARHAEPRRTPKKRGRASVPSWDEIMFGGGS